MFNIPNQSCPECGCDINSEEVTLYGRCFDCEDEN